MSSFNNNLAIAGIQAAVGDAIFLEPDKFQDGKTQYSANRIFRYTYPIFTGTTNADITTADINKSTSTTISLKPQSVSQNGKNEGDYRVYVMDIIGRKITIEDCCPETTFLELRYVVANYEYMPVHKVKLIYSGKMLADDITLKDIGNDCVLHMIYRQKGGGGCPAYHIKPDFFDTKYNYDFSKITDKQSHFFRGGKEYLRPIGSKRYALKVDGKYPNDDNWLGCNGGFEEWPVAYHGTKENNSLDIAKNGFDLSKGKRFLYGRGIYCTPDPATAKKYAVEYSYKDKQYHMIFQNRVNPKTMIVVKEADPNGLGEYWLVPNESDIRPYGICVFPA